MNPQENPKEIYISDQEVLSLVSAWESQVGRKPTDDEISRILNNLIEEEILYREALLLGLDQEDRIIKRRLAQKITFLKQETFADKLSEEELNNLAYTRFVLEAGYSGDFLDLLVALSPCVFGYGEIGLNLKSISKSDNPYISWIETYNSKEYQEVCINIGSLLDEATQDRLGKDFANNTLWPKLEKTFLIATKLEIDFWEMSLKPE
mgnify:CR=1 FL=1